MRQQQCVEVGVLFVLCHRDGVVTTQKCIRWMSKNHAGISYLKPVLKSTLSEFRTVFKHSIRRLTNPPSVPVRVGFLV